MRAAFLSSLLPEAGALALSYYRRSDLETHDKGPQDLVTAADLAVERFLIDRIRREFPDDGFVGEEGGEVPARGDGAVWVIDPIDGTANFARNIDLWCLSVAVVRGGEVETGAILNPVTSELFLARKGQGATRNGVPIRVSRVTEVGRARVCLGFSFRRPRDLHVTAIDRLLERGGEYSRLGSCALGLAYVADGRFEAYWEAHVNSWDAAAGLCLVQEAGGWVNDFLAGDGLHRGNEILASVPALAPFFRETLSPTGS